MPASQTQYLHIPVSGHSLVSERGHFWQGKFDGFKNRWELNFFSCLRCLVSGYSTIIMIDPWQTITSWKRRAFCNAVFSYERNTLKEIVWGMEYGRLTTINISKMNILHVKLIKLLTPCMSVVVSGHLGPFKLSLPSRWFRPIDQRKELKTVLEIMTGFFKMSS